MSDSLKIQRNKKLDEAMRILTDGTFRKMTGGKVKAMSREQAAAFLGNAIHETGSPDLSNLDVVENGSGAGRGMMQYTGARRNAYDRARPANTVRDQLRYAAEEYAGKHDPAPGQSLVGYTKALESAPPEMRKAVDHYLTQYFRPADASASRNARMNNAQQIYQQYQPRTPQPKPKPQPKPRQPANPFLGMMQNLLRINPR